ncbi:hypothetical protein SARC_05454, partial [Sphaeroforma arctica JP610]
MEEDRKTAVKELHGRIAVLQRKHEETLALAHEKTQDVECRLERERSLTRDLKEQLAASASKQRTLKLEIRKLKTANSVFEDELSEQAKYTRQVEEAMADTECINETLKERLLEMEEERVVREKQHADELDLAYISNTNADGKNNTAQKVGHTLSLGDLPLADVQQNRKSVQEWRGIVSQRRSNDDDSLDSCEVNDGGLTGDGLGTGPEVVQEGEPVCGQNGPTDSHTRSRGQENWCVHEHQAAAVSIRRVEEHGREVSEQTSEVDANDTPPLHSHVGKKFADSRASESTAGDCTVDDQSVYCVITDSTSVKSQSLYDEDAQMVTSPGELQGQETGVPELGTATTSELLQRPSHAQQSDPSSGEIQSPSDVAQLDASVCRDESAESVEHGALQRDKPDHQTGVQMPMAVTLPDGSSYENQQAYVSEHTAVCGEDGAASVAGCDIRHDALYAHSSATVGLEDGESCGDTTQRSSACTGEVEDELNTVQGDMHWRGDHNGTSHRNSSSGATTHTTTPHDESHAGETELTGRKSSESERTSSSADRQHTPRGGVVSVYHQTADVDVNTRARSCGSYYNSEDDYSGAAFDFEHLWSDAGESEGELPGDACVEGGGVLIDEACELDRNMTFTSFESESDRKSQTCDSRKETSREIDDGTSRSCVPTTAVESLLRFSVRNEANTEGTRKDFGIHCAMDPSANDDGLRVTAMKSTAPLIPADEACSVSETRKNMRARSSVPDSANQEHKGSRPTHTHIHKTDMSAEQRPNANPTDIHIQTQTHVHNPPLSTHPLKDILGMHRLTQPNGTACTPQLPSSKTSLHLDLGLLKNYDSYSSHSTSHINTFNGVCGNSGQHNRTHHTNAFDGRTSGEDTDRRLPQSTLSSSGTMKYRTSNRDNRKNQAVATYMRTPRDSPSSSTKGTKVSDSADEDLIADMRLQQILDTQCDYLEIMCAELESHKHVSFHRETGMSKPPLPPIQRIHTESMRVLTTVLQTLQHNAHEPTTTADVLLKSIHRINHVILAAVGKELEEQERDDLLALK